MNSRKCLYKTVFFMHFVYCHILNRIDPLAVCLSHGHCMFLFIIRSNQLREISQYVVSELRPLGLHRLNIFTTLAPSSYHNLNLEGVAIKGIKREGRRKRYKKT